MTYKKDTEINVTSLPADFAEWIPLSTKILWGAHIWFQAGPVVWEATSSTSLLCYSALWDSWQQRYGLLYLILVNGQKVVFTGLQTLWGIFLLGWALIINNCSLSSASSEMSSQPAALSQPSLVLSHANLALTSSFNLFKKLPSLQDEGLSHPAHNHKSMPSGCSCMQHTPGYSIQTSIQGLNG